MRLLFSLILFAFSILGYSQSLFVGQGTYGGTSAYGPMFATSGFDTAFSRQAYIYNSSVLTGLKHGDSITSFEFYAQADLPMSGSPNLKIFLKMTDKDTFPAGKLNWTNESKSSGMILVYDANPASLITGASGYIQFVFNKQKFVFDTSAGKKNLEVLFAYDQMTRQASNTYWLYENNLSVPAFKNINEGKINFGKGFAPDTTRISDVRKPHIRINFPRYSNNLGISKVYCLGKVPVLANVNDTIKILVENEGKYKVKNSKIYLNISGANSFSDSLTIDSISPLQKKLFNFGKFKPDSAGEDLIFVSLSKDEFQDNNFDTLKREVSYNVFSHADPYSNNSGGIGFNGSTGDFVAKFFSDTGIYINQVSVDFSSSGRGFRVGIWDDNGIGGNPGTVLFMSDSLISVGGTYILPVLPRIKISGGFFVGIRQNTGNNVAFSFQDEDPIRPGAFYFTAPMGSSSWVPFSPGFPYKFNIQPRIQVADDVAPLSITFPIANDEIEYSLYDSIGPKATIFNYGFNNQTTPFEVECKITNSFGIEEYKSTKSITLNSGQSKTIYFDTLFKLYNLGTHKITITTLLKGDKVVDNNSISHTFKVIVKHDISADIMYSPQDGRTFEYKVDTILPTIRITNIGTVDKNSFPVTFRIRNDTSIIHTETIYRSLGAGKQEIITFSKFVPVTVGEYVAECFTSLKDSIPYNDTVRSNVIFQKSNDVGPIKIDVPSPTAAYVMGGFFFPKLTIKNFGNKTQLVPFKTHMYVYDLQNKEFFYDTSLTQLGGFSETQIAFKRCNLPNAFGKYKVFFRTELPGDQEPLNDTITGFFTVVPNRDLSVEAIILPAKDTIISIESLPMKPSVKIKNLGSITQSLIGPVFIKIFRNSVLIFEDSVTVAGNLSYNSSLIVNFKAGFMYPTPGFMTCKVYTGLKGDLVVSNDTLITKFRLDRNFDIALDSLTNFSNGHVFEYENSYFKPQIVVKNNGAKSYQSNFSVFVKLYKDGKLIQSKTLNYDSIRRSQVISTFIDSFINLRQTGDFELCAYVLAPQDVNNNNDSACWNFRIEKSNDLLIDSIILPDKANFCYLDKTYSPRVKASNIGSKSIVNASILLNIYEGTNSIWVQGKQFDLLPGEFKWIKFDSTLNFINAGPGSARAIGFLINDSERTNDTARLTFNITETSWAKNLESGAFKIYPNPSHGLITIQCEDNSKLQLRINNASGQEIYSNTVVPVNGKVEMDLSNNEKFAKGLYQLKIQGSKSMLVYKLILL
jgi:hypothetical protein